MTIVARFLLLSGALLLIPAVSSADVIHVPSDHTRIQSAIVASRSGDTIIVAPGEYHETLNYGGRLITVRSSDGPAVTVITADSAQNLVTFDHGEDTSAVLEGFTLHGGWSAVSCNNSGPTIRRNILVDQNIDCWAAITLAGPGYPEATYGKSPAVIINNVITGSTNGAISTFSTESPTIRNNIIAFNANYGIHCQEKQLNLDIGYNNLFDNGTNLVNVMWSGRGAISINPLFNDDYTLQGGSPCIDAGDPSETCLDPDGSRCDMGAVPIGPRNYPLALGINFEPGAIADEASGKHPRVYWSYLDTTASFQAGYEMQIGTDLDWSSSEAWTSGRVMTSDTSAECGGGRLEDNSTYYLRVRLFDGQEWGGWQSHLLMTRSFILVGLSSNNPPYEFTDTHGKPAGFLVELTNAIMETMASRAEFRIGSPEVIASDLINQDLDVVVGMGYSYERNRSFDFTPAAVVTHHTVFARDDAERVGSPDQMRDKELVLVRGSLMHDYVEQNGLSEKLHLTDTPQQALRLLASGEHEYTLLARRTGLYWIDELELSNIHALGLQIEPSPLCYAVRKGDLFQRDRFTEALTILQQTGRYQDIYDKWLGVLEPPTRSLADYLKYLVIVLVPLLALLAGSLIWNRSLKHKVATRTAELNQELDERRKAQGALRESEERYRSLHDNLPVGVFRATPGGELLAVNPAFAEMLEYESVKEVLVIPAQKLITKPELMPEILVKLKADGDIIDLELQHRTKTGRIIWTTNTVHLEPDETGTGYNLYGTVRDITQRKEAEEKARVAEQERYEQAKRISGVFAHEIRNALFPASAALSQLKKTYHPDESPSGSVREYIDIASQAVNNAKGTTTLISSYNKLDTEVMPETVQFSEVIDDFIRLNRMRLNEDGIRLNSSGPKEITVRSNHRQLPMVLNNLLSNAIYALEERPDPQINVHWSADGDFLRLQFQDNGTGIPQNELSMIFEPFFSTKRRREGIGIGLATTRKILEMYAGTIEVESVEGEGTRFDLKIRLASGQGTQ